MPDTTIRPALAAMAADPDTLTLRKLWKALTADEKSLAITASLNDDENGWVKNTTRAAVAKILKFRPQTVAQMPKQKLISEAVRLPIDDIQLLGAYMVDLHLGHRRPMMKQFLDALGIANEDGRIDGEGTQIEVQDADAISRAAGELVKTFPADEVVTYFLTLLLQDSGIWEGVRPWLKTQQQQ